MIPGLKTALKQIGLFTVAASALMAGPILTPSPSGALSGTPGSTVGWGFTLTNDVNWIEVVQAQFCLDSPLSNPCFLASAQFVDIISNPPNDVIVGPSGSASQPYAPLSFMGLGSFLIAPGAVPGSSVVGNILLTYNEFDGDPNQGGNQIGFNEAISASASVTAAGSAVPEPATWGLAAIALAGLGARRLRRRG
jgi:MYXO-CTERM domain-containing protein